jgi:hypothetical protein
MTWWDGSTRQSDPNSDFCGFFPWSSGKRDAVDLVVPFALRRW